VYQDEHLLQGTPFAQGRYILTSDIFHKNTVAIQFEQASSDDVGFGTISAPVTNTARFLRSTPAILPYKKPALLDT